MICLAQIKKTTGMELVNKYDKYIKGELTEGEMDQFTKEIVKEHFKEEQLKEKWNTILEGDEELQALKNGKQITVSPNTPAPPAQRSSKIKRLRILFSIAASFLLLIGLGYFLSRPTTASFAQLADLQLEQPYSVSSSRSAAVEGQETRLLANDFYRQGDYTSAAPLYEELTQGERVENSDLFYLGLSQLYLGEAQKAITPLKALATAQSDQLKVEASWFLGLAYLKANQLIEAEIQLKRLQEKGGWKSKEAAELLAAIKKS